MMMTAAHGRKANFHLRIITALAALLGCAGEARCQTTSPTTPRLTMQGPAEQSSSPAIRDALNRPCLDVEAAARGHLVDREVMDHVVSMKNNCSRLIKVKVCYYNSDHCNQVDVPGYQRVDTTLGSMRGNTYFRYTLQQK